MSQTTFKHHWNFKLSANPRAYCGTCGAVWNSTANEPASLCHARSTHPHDWDNRTPTTCNACGDLYAEAGHSGCSKFQGPVAHAGSPTVQNLKSSLQNIGPQVKPSTVVLKKPFSGAVDIGPVGPSGLGVKAPKVYPRCQDCDRELCELDKTYDKRLEGLCRDCQPHVKKHLDRMARLTTG